MQPRQLLSPLFGSGLFTDRARSAQLDSFRRWLVPLTVKIGFGENSSKCERFLHPSSLVGSKLEYKDIINFDC